MEHFNWVTGFILPYLNFCIFAFLLVKFAKSPLQNLAKQRAESLLKEQKESEMLEREVRELEKAVVTKEQGFSEFLKKRTQAAAQQKEKKIKEVEARYQEMMQGLGKEKKQQMEALQFDMGEQIKDRLTSEVEGLLEDYLNQAISKENIDHFEKKKLEMLASGFVN